MKITLALRFIINDNELTVQPNADTIGGQGVAQHIAFGSC